MGGSLLSRIIETTEKGQKLLEEYKESVRLLAGYAYEMMVTNPSTVLSPYFRETLGRLAKQAQDQHLELSNYLCVDYLHND